MECGGDLPPKKWTGGRPKKFCKSKCKNDYNNRRLKGQSASCIYLLQHPSWPGFVKVGKAANLYSRLAVYNAGCPRRAYIVTATINVEDHHSAELIAHAALSVHRYGNTEWFTVDIDDALDRIGAALSRSAGGGLRQLASPTGTQIRDQGPDGTGVNNGI